MVSLGPISSEFAWSRGSPNSVTSDDWLSQNAWVFRAEPPEDNLGEVCFKLAGLDDQRVCSLSFWVCRGYFERRLAANISVLLGVCVLREKWFRFRTCRCCKASAATKNLRCEEVCRILVALRSGKKFVVLLHSAHRSHGSSNSSGGQWWAAVAGLTADLGDSCCAGCNNMGRENSADLMNSNEPRQTPATGMIYLSLPSPATMHALR
ncbi:hypothetical protein V2W45_255077 [Cenococcum geophilum]